jgi:hypothetical protein
MVASTEPTPTRRQRIVARAFFAVLLLVSLGIVGDYGLSWDEPAQRYNVGRPNCLWAFTFDYEPLAQSQDRWYGPAYEMVLIVLEQALFLRDARSIWLARHAANFLLFYLAVLVFHGLLRRRFGAWPALAGAAFLVLSPRIFADAFFNCKDLAFLSFYVFALATLELFLRRPGLRTAALHALACGWLIDVRMPGVMLAATTVLLFAGLWLLDWRDGRPSRFGLAPLLGYCGLTPLFVVAFWPFLWRDPTHFVRCFQVMSHYPWSASAYYDGLLVNSDTVLYLGQQVRAAALPWHYALVWLGVTTPLAYLALIAGGLGAQLARLARSPLSWLRDRPTDAIMLLAWSLPLGAVIALRSTLYDGWRHLFFIYPPLLYFGVLCLAGLLDAARSWRPWPRLAPRAALAGVLGCCAWTAFVMARDHPHQNVYFNRLAGRDLQEAKARFELDYWGLSCRRGLEYIVAHDDAEVIPVCWASQPVMYNALLLPAEQRARLRWTTRPEEARYFVSHFRFHPAEHPTDHEVFCVKVDGAKVLVVHRLDADLARREQE